VVLVPQNCPLPNIRRAAAAAIVLVAALVLTPLQHAAAHDGKDGKGVPAVPESPVGGGREGPVTAADRDLVVRVRLAGLWEMPAGTMAATKGVNPTVRRIGREIAGQHGVLDRLALEAAEQLGIPLPDQPTPEQLDWLGEMERASGDEFDRVFVLRLRAAHGAIFPGIASIRAGTHNDVVRRLAQQANQFVLTHLTLLESTGLVDYAEDVPSPPDPPPLHLTALSAVEARAGAGGAPALAIWGVLATALLAGGLAVARVLRPG
jgi:predicted outer membrane protein